MTSTARLALNLERKDQELLSRAASLMGTTLSGFVRIAAKEKAQALLDQESRISLSNRDFDNLQAALATAFAPNPALQQAMQAAALVKLATPSP